MRLLRFDYGTLTAREIAKLIFWFFRTGGTHSSECASCEEIRKRLNVGVLGFSLFD